MILDDGTEVRRAEPLAGGRFAVQHQNVLYVSPALYDLLAKETGEARMHLLQNMRIAKHAGDGPITDEWLRTFRSGLGAMDVKE
jgi:hypothetical protein